MKKENIYTQQKNIGKNGANGNFAVQTGTFDEAIKSLKVAMLFCPDAYGNGFENVKTVARIVKNDFQDAKVFCFLHKTTKHHDIAPLDGFEIIDGKKFNIFGKLKKNTFLQLNHTPYDLIIVFGKPVSKHCKKILNAFDTKIKAGQTFENSDRFFDISIGAPNKKMNCEVFYKQLFEYLKILKIDFSNNMN